MNIILDNYVEYTHTHTHTHTQFVQDQDRTQKQLLAGKMAHSNLIHMLSLGPQVHRLNLLLPWAQPHLHWVDQYHQSQTEGCSV